MADSLASVGFASPRSAGVSLVETSVPASFKAKTVLCQNAWNFLPPEEFTRLAEPYPLSSRLRYRARRALASFNTSCAGRVLTLTEAMSDLLAVSGLASETFPVTVPLDILEGLNATQPRWLEAKHEFVLVPGTLTWYKNPGYALRLMAPLRDTSLTLVFAGTDDGSGCQASVSDRAREQGVRHHIAPVTRPEMRWLLENSSLTLIPSDLESLSFSLAEALLLSRRVAASPLKVHREVAGRLDREPIWLDESASLDRLLGEQGYRASPDGSSWPRFRGEWVSLARELRCG